MGVLLVFGGGPGIAGERNRQPTPTPAPTATPDPHSLASLASKIKLHKPAAAPGSGGVVITNENIKHYAEEGKLTTASGQPAGRAATGVPRGTTTGQRKISDDAKKTHWRNTYIRQKQLVESIQKRMDELNREIPGLWRDFYAWDDPAYRDGVIKPRIDKKMKELEELKKRLPVEQQKLPKILEDARRDGAQPGWFRDLT